MNNLSWMIYAADVAGSVGYVSGTAITVGIVTGAIAMVVAGCTMESEPQIAKACLRYAHKVVLPCTIGAAIALVVIPSETTIYAIAASETGEEVLNSETERNNPNDQPNCNAGLAKGHSQRPVQPDG